MPERVLLIDDEDFVLRALRGYLAPLERAGEVVVTSAGDGPAAVELARTAAAAGRPFDLAVIDFQMTDEMNGLETLQELRKHCPDVAAVMLTGQAQQNTPMEALNLGFRHYLVKPATREAFLSAVDGQLRQLRLAKANRTLQEALRRFHGVVRTLTGMVRTSAELADPVDRSAVAAAITGTACRVAGAREALLLLLPESGPHLVAYGNGGEPRPDVRVAVGDGVVGMAMSAGGPVTAGREEPPVAGAAPDDTPAATLCRRWVTAVPLSGAGGSSGVLLIPDAAGVPDPALDAAEVPSVLPGEGGVAGVPVEPALAMVARLAGLALEAVLGQRSSRRLLVESLREGLGAGGHEAEPLLADLHDAMRALDQSLAGGGAGAGAGTTSSTGAGLAVGSSSVAVTRSGVVGPASPSAAATSPGTGASGSSAPVSPGPSPAVAGQAGRDAAAALELAGVLRDISAFGPEAVAFCRTTLERFRDVLRRYEG